MRLGDAPQSTTVTERHVLEPRGIPVLLRYEAGADRRAAVSLLHGWTGSKERFQKTPSDVSRRAESVPPVALLILHGRRDPDVPAASAEALHAALLPHYAGCADRLRLKVYPALGHTISRPESAEVAAAQQELREDVNGWFGRFL